MKIITTQKNDTAEYAALELKKYVMGLSRGEIVPEITVVDRLDGALRKGDPDGGRPFLVEEGTVILALLGELSLRDDDLEDPFVEDIIDVDVNALTGYIAGSNMRSILMGVYRYCTSAGCRFLRPGADGDYVPSADLYNHSYRYRKKADQPFRGECSEGASSYEHMRDTVYWLPKIGMNMYMIEGMVPYQYMHKWYGHEWNTKLRIQGQVTDYGMLEKYIELLKEDVKKTGIQLHTLGHGWMFEKLGLHSDYYSDVNAERLLTPEAKRHLALVGGKRGLMHGSTFYTHFCYSNPETRKLLVSFITEYITKNPQVDFVHMWLADAINNECECEECRKMHLSDYYVTMLNELDEELTKMGSDTRIVFIAYNVTVRPPAKMRLKNPKRFLLLTAIGLHYEKGYLCEEYKGEIPAYVRNDHHPEPNALRLKWAREWREMNGNIPSVMYEYRFYSDMYHDLGQMQVVRETHRDMRGLKKLAFNGCMSDQTPRMYMPTALPLIMMGATLFDGETDRDALTDFYFEGAFGQDGPLVREYLETLSDLLCPSNYRAGSAAGGVEEEGIGMGEAKEMSWIDNPSVAEKAARIPGHIEGFLPVITKNISAASDDARILSWMYLQYHAEICRRFSEILLAGAQNDMDGARALFPAFRDWLSEHEMEFHRAFDVYLFLRCLSLSLGVEMPDFYE